MRVLTNIATDIFFVCVYFELDWREQDCAEFSSFLIISPAGPRTHFLHSYYCCASPEISITRFSLFPPLTFHPAALFPSFFLASLLYPLPHFPSVYSLLMFFSILGNHQNESRKYNECLGPPQVFLSLVL